MRKSGVAGVILAGGRSSRMGGGDNKALLPLAGRPMLAHLLKRLRPQVGRLAINANGDPARFDAYALPVVSDPLPGLPGPLAGILAAMQWASAEGAARVVTAAGDTPFPPRDLVARLAAASDEHTIAVSRSCGRLHPTFALWPVALRDELERFLASGKKARVTDFVEGHYWSAVDFPAEALPGGHVDPFFNINTPDDLTAAQAFFHEEAG